MEKIPDNPLQSAGNQLTDSPREASQAIVQGIQPKRAVARGPLDQAGTFRDVFTHSAPGASPLIQDLFSSEPKGAHSISEARQDLAGLWPQFSEALDVLQHSFQSAIQTTRPGPEFWQARSGELKQLADLTELGSYLRCSPAH